MRDQSHATQRGLEIDQRRGSRGSKESSESRNRGERMGGLIDDAEKVDSKDRFMVT